MKARPAAHADTRAAGDDAVMPRAANAAGGGIVSAALNDTNNVTAPLLSFLQRLRDLDEQSAELERGLRDAVDARLDDIRRNPAKRAKPSGPGPGPGPGPDDSAPGEIETRVRRDGRRCVAIADEKVALAQQAYDLVDQHIARLDKDLRAYDAALAEREAAAAAASGLGGAGAGAGPGTGAGAGAGDRQSLAQMMEAQRMAQVGGATGVGAAYSEGGAPVDPNEPKYCVCNRVSFGEMIACENEGCAVEWFHFACVGLSSDAKIKGKWFCAACTAERRKQKKLLAKEGK